MPVMSTQLVFGHRDAGTGIHIRHEVDDLLALGLDVELRHDDVALLGLQGRDYRRERGLYEVGRQAHLRGERLSEVDLGADEVARFVVVDVRRCAVIRGADLQCACLEYRRRGDLRGSGSCRAGLVRRRAAGKGQGESRDDDANQDVFHGSSMNRLPIKR